MRRETKYQRDLVKRLHVDIPGSVVLRNNPAYIQGIPDLLVLWEDRWAMLEVKRSADEETQPNQEYYVEALDKMSFAAFIYPENEDEVIDALQSAFGTTR